MENTLKIEKKIMIDAPVTQVWQALTTSSIVEKYFFGNTALSDWNVGSSLIFKGEWEGEEYLGRGIILNRVPYKLFRFSYWSSLSGLENKSQNYLHVSYRLSEERDSVTELITTVEKIPTQDLRDKMNKDLDKLLKSMKRVMETEVFEEAY